MICYTFSAYLFTVLFEYLCPRDGPRDPGSFSVGKKIEDLARHSTSASDLENILMTLSTIPSKVICSYS